VGAEGDGRTGLERGGGTTIDFLLEDETTGVDKGGDAVWLRGVIGVADTEELVGVMTGIGGLEGEGGRAGDRAEGSALMESRMRVLVGRRNGVFDLERSLAC
jgi:hypothetical protein